MNEVDRNEPACEDAGSGDGFGCPECKRFEVRTHPVTCKVHGDHMDLMCCWCGTVFFSFNEVDHDESGHPGKHTDRTIQ